MAAAAVELRNAVDSVEPALPSFEVWANVTARPYRPGEVRDLLVRQLESPVRFAESLEAMARRVGLFVHVGPGDVTAGMARRAASGVAVLVVNDLASLATTVERLREMAGED